MKKKRNNNIYTHTHTHIPKPDQQCFGNPGKPNYSLRFTYFSNPEYDKFLRRQQQLKTRKK